jgi:internalin A
MDWNSFLDLVEKGTIKPNVLSLGGREIDQLPSEIGSLNNLIELHFYENNLSELPPEIGKLKNLVVLGLGCNKINKLPPDMGKLKNLEELYLENNKLESLPRELAKLQKLKYLNLKQNQLPIPPEILNKTNEPATILNYYFSVLKDKDESTSTAKPLNETKVLIVGQGSVGKTSIVKRLINGTFNLSENKTDGIDINRWEITENIKDGPIQLNIWDFGGQEIMHATHQFFLTKRSLYLLVLDSRLTQEENRTEYWLKIIQSFGGDSPVLIVGNKTDQHPLDIDKTGLLKKYSNLVEIIEVSAATGAGFEQLEKVIKKQVNNLPHVHDLLPQKWFRIKTRLEELRLKYNFITQDDYSELCVDNEVPDDISQRTLIGFLHDLGVILHFQDDPRLESLGILNPQWVTNGVYKILNSHELFQSRGILTIPLLNKILNLPEYPSDKRLFIVDMMKKFELCYDIETDNSFLIPDLLPKDEPFTGEWNDALVFHYSYNVLPSSIISRFVVRMNPFIYKTVWRSGVVLKNNENIALVKADFEDRKIYISVMGEETTKRDFLSSIRTELEAIHRTITKIETHAKVPVPGYAEIEPIEFSFLLQCERDGRKTFPAQAGNRIIDINVHDLLNGVRSVKGQESNIFISYSHSDKVFVERLAKDLEKKGNYVWWDFEKIKGGQNWQKEIEKAIFQCQYFLIVVTPESVSSDWVANEITYAILRNKIIIPLYLKTCDIPLTLVNKQYINFKEEEYYLAIRQLEELLKEEYLKQSEKNSS